MEEEPTAGRRLSQPLTREDIVRHHQTCAPLPPTLLTSTPHSTLLSLLQSPPPSFPLLQYLSSLLSLISQTTPPLLPSLSSLLSSIFFLFISRNARRRDDLPKILHLFSLHLPSLPNNLVPPIVDAIVDDIPDVVDADDALPFDLLPQLLGRLQSTEEIEPNANYVASVLDKLLVASWSKPLLSKMVSLLRDFPPMDKSRSCDFVEKVFAGMRSADLQDLPSLAYQLLVLASKGFGKKMVVDGIVRFFGARSGSAVARQIEGTVLLHMNFAVKQDPSLGQEVLGLVKSDLSAFNHFTVAVLLSVARVRRFNEIAMRVLNLAVVSSYRDHQFARDCKWVPDSTKEECLQIAKSVEKAVIRAINESNYGREHIVPSVVQFGFVLLESTAGGSEEHGGTDILLGIIELGIQVLTTLFEVHDMTRNEIIEQCKFHILSLKHHQSVPIIKLLGYLVQRFPFPMLEHIGQLKELLDYFTYMNEKTAVSLVTSLLPLVKYSRNLQDYFILVVRKAMFRREDTIRIAATKAIICLIAAEKKSKVNSLNSLQDSSSQASSSQQTNTPSGVGTDLFQELNGLLQRCLSQQARSREIIYWGLLKLVVLDPLIAGHVFDFLWLHFLRFYSEDEDIQLRISSCVKLENGKVLLEEPLDCLLSCVSWILVLQPQEKIDRPWIGFSLSQENEQGGVSSAESFSNAFLKIRMFLRKGKLEGVLSRCGVTGSQHVEDEKTNYCSLVLSGILEVVINVVVMELQKATDANKGNLEKELMELIDLYDYMQKGTSVVKQGSAKYSSKTTSRDELDKTAQGTKDSPRSVPLKFQQARRNFLTTSCIHQLLLNAMKLYTSNGSNISASSQLHSQSSISKKPVYGLKMVSFALKACLNHLKSLACMENDDPLKTLIYGDINVLGCPLLQLILLLKSQPKFAGDQKKKVKGKNIDDREQIHLSLMCLNELFKISLCSPQLNSLVEDLISVSSIKCDSDIDMDVCGNEDTELDQMVDNPCVANMHLFLEKRMKPLLSEFLTRLFFKESEVLSEMVLMIGNKLPHKRRNSHGAWAFDTCRTVVTNPKAARSVVALAIYLRSSPDDLMVAQVLASELLKVIGSEDTAPVEQSVAYPIVNSSTGNALTSLLLQLIDSVIADLDWAISKLKILSTYACESSDPEMNNHFMEKSPGLILEEALFSRSEGLVNLLSPFAEMRLVDSQAEQLLKMAARLYKQLARMAKLQIAPKGCKQALPAHKFQKLAEVACKKLTAPIYNFVALIQQNQQGNMQSRGIIKKINRETRCIPDLIFQIEDYEKYLIQLSKLTKVNLLRHAKRSIARDFRILDGKRTRQEETPDSVSPPVHSIGSRDESNDEPDGENENGFQRVVPTDSNLGAEAENLVSESEEEEMVVSCKRTKLRNVVQDSDEEP